MSLTAGLILNWSMIRSWATSGIRFAKSALSLLGSNAPAPGSGKVGVVRLYTFFLQGPKQVLVPPDLLEFIAVLKLEDCLDLGVQDYIGRAPRQLTDDI